MDVNRSNSKRKRYFGMTGTQISILAAMGVLVTAIFGIGLALILNNSNQSLLSAPLTIKASPESSRCIGMLAWLDDTKSRMAEGQRIARELPTSKSNLPTASFARAWRDASASYAQLVTNQRLSNPPVAAQSTNTTLVSGIDKFSSGAKMFADAFETGDSAISDAASKMINDGSSLFNEAGAMIDDLSAECP